MLVAILPALAYGGLIRFATSTNSRILFSEASVIAALGSLARASSAASSETETCSAVGNPFELSLDARISKSISSFASRDRIGKPAFLITRLAQRRRQKPSYFSLTVASAMLPLQKNAPGRIGRKQGHRQDEIWSFKVGAASEYPQKPALAHPSTPPQSAAIPAHQFAAGPLS
jgi:hypothetical protein